MVVHAADTTRLRLRRLPFRAGKSHFREGFFSEVRVRASAPEGAAPSSGGRKRGGGQLASARGAGCGLNQPEALIHDAIEAAISQWSSPTSQRRYQQAFRRLCADLLGSGGHQDLSVFFNADLARQHMDRLGESLTRLRCPLSHFYRQVWKRLDPAWESNLACQTILSIIAARGVASHRVFSEDTAQEFITQCSDPDVRRGLHGALPAWLRGVAPIPRSADSLPAAELLRTLQGFGSRECRWMLSYIAYCQYPENALLQVKKELGLVKKYHPLIEDYMSVVALGVKDVRRCKVPGSLERFLRRTQHMDPTKLTPGDLVDYRNFLLSRAARGEMKSTAAALQLRIAMGWLRFLHQRKITGFYPCVPPIPEQRETKTVVAQEEHVLKIVEALPSVTVDPLWAIVRVFLMYSTASRPAALRNLRLGDLQHRADGVWVTYHAKNTVYSVPVPAPVVPYLEAWLTAQPVSLRQHVFGSAIRGRSDMAFARILKKAAEVAGLPRDLITPRELRRAAATRMARDVPLVTVDKILGHEGNLRYLTHYVVESGRTGAVLDQISREVAGVDTDA